MPSYKYSCATCDHSKEVTHGIKSSLVLTCPTCKAKLERVIYPVGVQFKGGGWEKDGYSRAP